MSLIIDSLVGAENHTQGNPLEKIIKLLLDIVEQTLALPRHELSQFWVISFNDLI